MTPTFTEAHPYAEIFALHEDNLGELGKRIKMNGLREPIVKLGDLILDGRRRERGCHHAGVKPVYRQFGTRKTDGDDPLEFVIDLNLHRRHLGEGERALAAARYATAQAGRPKPSPAGAIIPDEPPTNEAAAKRFKTTVGKIRRAKVIIEGGSAKLIKAVRDDAISLSDAEKISKLPPKAQNRAVKAVLAKEATSVWEAAHPMCARCQEAGRQEDCGACKHKHEQFCAGKKIVEQAPANLTDECGQLVPMHLIPVFETIQLFKTAMSKLTSCAKAMKKVETSAARTAKPIEKNAHYVKYYATFYSCRRRVEAMRPWCVCPKCDGEGCEHCQELGWMTFEMFEATKPQSKVS